MSVKEVKEYNSQFEPEVFEIAAVTGFNGVGGGKVPNETLWNASIELIAWQDLSSGEIHEEKLSLGTLVKEVDELRKQMPAKSIITVKVQKSREGFGRRFNFIKKTDSGNNFPELWNLLEKQSLPVYYDDEVLGRFELDKSVGWFEKKFYGVRKKFV